MFVCILQHISCKGNPANAVGPDNASTNNCSQEPYRLPQLWTNFAIVSKHFGPFYILILHITKGSYPKIIVMSLIHVEQIPEI